MLRSKTLALLMLVGTIGAAHAEFKIGMSEAQISQEAQKQLDLANQEKKTIKQIVEEAYDAQLDMGVVTTALVSAGADMSLVVDAVIRVGISPELVVSSAVKAGANRDLAVKVAIAAGADPGILSTATAAGKERK